MPRATTKVYRQRFIDRGNTEDFLEVFINGWDYYIDKLETDKAEKRIVLEPYQYLGDVIECGIS